MPPRGFAPGRLAPGLTIGSHNVRGLRAADAAGQQRVHALAQQWLDQRWDIVCVQETWLNDGHQLSTEQHLQAAAATRLSAPYTAFWAHAQSPSQRVDLALAGAARPGGRPRAGVGILVSSSLLASGQLAIIGDPVRHDSGRFISLRLAWAGHTFTLCCVYLPSGDAAGQRAFLQQHVAPLAAAGGDLLVAGDWNFAASVALDRFRQPGQQHASPAAPSQQHQYAGAARRHPDEGTSQLFSQLCPQLHDAFRRFHPHCRSYTYLSGAAASRIDRIYASSSLLPHLERCQVLPASVSDHRPLFLHLRPRRPAAFGPGLHRVRLHHCNVAELAQQMSEWLQEQVGGAPADPGELLRWWPGFKERVAATARQLDRLAQQRAQARSASVAAAEQAVQLACTRVEQGDAAAIPDVVHARQHYTAAATAAAAGSATHARHSWLHTGEQPCPLLTALTRPPASSSHTPCLRAAVGGGLLTDPHLIAQRMADHFAAISTAPARDPAAEEEVLAALRAAGRTLPQAAAAAVGAAEVRPSEVLAALRSAKLGKAPGLDGLPPYFWRYYRSELAALLARLYTTCNQLNQLPADFTLGVIRALPKKGDLAEPANYRPITLLNADYRLLARVLASRIAPALATVVAPSQTAFLPGRRIGENVLFLQLLPGLLRAGLAGGDGASGSGASASAAPAAAAARSPQQAAVAFLDFAKAYDTVQRPFLFAAMEAMGAGDGLMRWVRLLLLETKASAVVNGWNSAAVASTAGVRQGCPLSPALYLFVAQALHSWLDSRGHGVFIAGQRTVGPQFADDAEVLLPSAEPAVVQPFLASMAVFARASNQHLNVGKCELLPVGAVPASAPPPGSTVCGLPVVARASALGMWFSNDATAPTTDWEARLQGVESCYSRLARLPLSTFGRAFGASGYGISKLLYHAEFSAWTPAFLQRLDLISGKLVDRGRAPSAAGPALPGVHKRLLSGHPRVGGFGMLPWREHVAARHAWWGDQLLSCLLEGTPPADQPLWVQAAATHLSALGEDSTHPAIVWAAAAMGEAGAFLPIAVTGGAACRRLPEGPLSRLAAGLSAVGRLGMVQAPQPGAWCWAAPVWGNPLLDVRHTDPHLSLLPGAATLGGLVALWERARTWDRPGVTQDEWLRGMWGTSLGCNSLLRMCVQDRCRFLASLATLKAAIPPAWWAAAAEVHAAPPQQARPSLPAALRVILASAGWPAPVGGEDWGAVPCHVSTLTVRGATALQMGPISAQRSEAHTAYIASARGVSAGDVSAAERADLRRTLAAAWALPWENRNKELLWRCAVHGVQGAGGCGIATLHSCPCGGLAAGATAVAAQQHHFWSCPVAAAVTAAVAGAGAVGDRPLGRAEVWLATQGEGRRVHAGVWLVVCMAALAAMDYGRRKLTAMHLASQPIRDSQGRRQQSLHEAWHLPQPDPAGTVVERAGRAAVARFWSMLADFASVQTAPASWAQLPTAGHPFLVRDGSGGAGAAVRVRIVVPPPSAA